MTQTDDFEIRRHGDHYVIVLKAYEPARHGDIRRLGYAYGTRKAAERALTRARLREFGIAKGW
jgi:hypothetical protein